MSASEERNCMRNLMREKRTMNRLVKIKTMNEKVGEFERKTVYKIE